MKILFLSWNFPPTMGGMEYVAGNLFERLGAEHEVRALVPYTEGAVLQGGVERAPRRGIAAYVRFVFARGMQLCRRDRPDVMLCISVVPGLPAAMLSRLFGIPVVILAHGSDILHKGALYQLVIRWILRRATAIAANSHQTKSLMIEAGFDGNRIRVIYPGVLTSVSQTAAKGRENEFASLVEGRSVILTVGRLIRRKGVLQFVEEVMPGLVKRHPEVLYLVVGDDAKESLVHHERLRDQIVQRTMELGLDSHVRLLGAIPSASLQTLYSTARLFVLPCLSIPGDVEGFGIVFSEAALAGIPSVATRVGGIPEAVIDGETGILVEPGDHAGMLDAIDSLLNDPQRCRALAEAGRSRAIRELGWGTIAEQYVGLLERARQGC